jgi:hypothetical protein
LITGGANEEQRRETKADPPGLHESLLNPGSRICRKSINNAARSLRFRRPVDDGGGRKLVGDDLGHDREDLLAVRGEPVLPVPTPVTLGP